MKADRCGIRSEISVPPDEIGGMHAVQPCAVRQPRVDERGRIVEPASRGGREPLREPTDVRLRGELDIRPLEPVAAVDPHRRAGR